MFLCHFDCYIGASVVDSRVIWIWYNSGSKLVPLPLHCVNSTLDFSRDWSIKNHSLPFWLSSHCGINYIELSNLTLKQFRQQTYTSALCFNSIFPMIDLGNLNKSKTCSLEFWLVVKVCNCIDVYGKLWIAFGSFKSICKSIYRDTWLKTDIITHWVYINVFYLNIVKSRCIQHGIYVVGYYIKCHNDR